MFFYPVWMDVGLELSVRTLLSFPQAFYYGRLGRCVRPFLCVEESHAHGIRGEALPNILPGYRWELIPKGRKEGCFGALIVRGRQRTVIGDTGAPDGVGLPDAPAFCNVPARRKVLEALCEAGPL